MYIIKNILMFLVGFVFFVPCLVLFAPFLTVSALCRLLTGFVVIVLFCSLLLIGKACGADKEAQEEVKEAGHKALEKI